MRQNSPGHTGAGRCDPVTVALSGRSSAPGHHVDVSRCMQSVDGTPSEAELKVCFPGVKNGPSEKFKHLIEHRMKKFDQLRVRARAKVTPVEPTLVEEPVEAACRVRADGWQEKLADGSENTTFDARKGTRVIVAAHVGDIWPAHASGLRYGTDHGRRLYDPNALTLVEMDDVKWFFPKPTMSANETSQHSRRELLEKLRKQEQAKGSVPSPLVLRVKAGDCMVVWQVNALRAVDGGRPQFLADARGDAPMPRIVPLNVGGAFEGSTQRQLRPSSDISISMPLPVYEPNRLGETVNLPVGVNRLSNGQIKSQSARIVNAVASEDDPPKMVAVRYIAQMIARNDLPDEQLKVQQIEKTEEIGLALAFGVLPIRPMGDVINHAQHGLYGAVIVEPRPGSADRPKESCAGANGCVIEHPAINFTGSYASIPPARVREHVLVFQDGLNLWSNKWSDRAELDEAHHNGHGNGEDKSHDHLVSKRRPLPDCPTCDDSYDWGEKGVSYRTEPFNRRLAGHGGAPETLGLRHYPDDKSNLNGFVFPKRFLSSRFRPISTPVLRMQPREQTMVRVLHPSGRARQRAFVTYGVDYHDLFPGFGSAHSALLGPGKALTASFCAPQVAGEYLWRDGPQHIFAAGVWGHFHVGTTNGPAASRCEVVRTPRR